MNKIKKILAPTDLSRLSLAGLRYALELAKGSGAEVLVYHAVRVEEIAQYARGSEETTVADYASRSPQHLLTRHEQALKRFLETSCADLIPKAGLRQRVEFAKPSHGIVEEAKRSGADMIVLSTHGRTGLSHALVGSVTEKVVREARCPVLSIRPEALKEEQARAVS